jgi:hypothetical protein
MVTHNFSNVDRYFAMWQAINSDYVPSGQLKSPLYPFKISSTSYWTSLDAQRTESLGYSYPGVITTGNNAGELTKANFIKQSAWSLPPQGFRTWIPGASPTPPLDLSRAWVYLDPIKSGYKALSPKSTKWNPVSGLPEQISSGPGIVVAPKASLKSSRVSSSVVHGELKPGIVSSIGPEKIAQSINQPESDIANSNGKQVEEAINDVAKLSAEQAKSRDWYIDYEVEK